MPKKDRPETQSDAEDISVHLKPILGVRPGAYLSAIYGLVVALVLFFVLFYPGLHHRGVYLSVKTFPDHATVRVDGVYAASTPCIIFLRHGDRTVEILKPYYAPVANKVAVRGRVFATLLVPDRVRESHTLQVADLAGLLGAAFADFQRNPQIPQLISDAAWASAGASPHQPLYDFIDNSMRFVSDETQIRELIVAVARVATSGSFLTPSSVVEVANQIVQLQQKYEDLPAWLLRLLSQANASRLATSSWVQQYLSAYRDEISRYYQPGELPPSGPGETVSFSGMVFRAIPLGSLVMGKDDNLDSIGKSIDFLFPHPVHVDPFYFGTTEVTNSQYFAFTSENPAWAPSNRAALVEKGLAADTYLADWQNGRYPPGDDGRPVTFVSWHAATAFAQWLTQKIQAGLPGYVARLPLESEWEWAARGGLRGMPYPLGGKPGGAVFFQKGITGPASAGASEPNGYGLRDILGNVWEWCADPFSPTAYLLTSLDPVQNAATEKAMPDAPDHVVRGGAWSSQPGTDKVYTRGSQPSDWCTPYLGFRVALSRR